MGLLSIIRKLKQKEKQLRILILGLDNAGKTTVVKKLKGEDTSRVSPTLGFNIDTLLFADYTLHLWDVGGQKSLRCFWKNYFEASDALVWVVDSADRHRMQDCKEELLKLLGEQRLSGAPLLVLANKQDLGSAAAYEEIAQRLGLLEIRSRQWKIVGCSAFSGEGLREGMEWVVSDVAAGVL